MKAFLYMVFTIIWVTQSTLGQFYYTPSDISPTIYQPYLASPNVFYQPYQFTAPESNFDYVQNFKTNPQDESQIIENLDYAQSSKPSDDLSSNRFRGFGYHNKLNQDATSTVVFFSGLNSLNKDEKISVAVKEAGGQDSNNIEKNIRDIFSNKLTAKTMDPEKDSFQDETHYFSPLTPTVKDILQNQIPRGSVYYFYSVPATQANQISIQSRALFENKNSTNEDLRDHNTLNSTTTEKSIKMNESTEKRSTIPDEKKAMFVIEYKSSSTEESRQTNMTSTTPKSSDTTTDSTTTMTDSN